MEPRNREKANRVILNDVFDKVYCITVADFHDRHRLVRNQLDRVDFEWICSPPAKYLKSTPLTPTEVSVNIGHMECLWNAKLNDYKKIAIWEDDGTLIATETVMKDFFDALPLDWDCLYMANASWNDGIWEVNTTPYSEYVNKVSWATGAGFNAVQSHVYDDLLSFFEPMDSPADFNYYKIFGRGNSYCPAKGFFSDPISAPDEKMMAKVKSPKNLIPSKIIHTL